MLRRANMSCGPTDVEWRFTWTWNADDGDRLDQTPVARK